MCHLWFPFRETRKVVPLPLFLGKTLYGLIDKNYYQMEGLFDWSRIGRPQNRYELTGLSFLCGWRSGEVGRTGWIPPPRLYVTTQSVRSPCPSDFHFYVYSTFFPLPFSIWCDCN